MSGIQISGLLANSAFDWKSVVDQLVEVSGIPIKKLEAEKKKNDAQAEALASLGAALTELQDAVQEFRANETFSARTVSSDASSTTWKSSSVTGAALGTYTFDVTQLATQARWTGSSDVGSELAPSDDVSGLTLATLATALEVTEGTITIDGKRIAVATTDSLQDVFDAIRDALAATTATTMADFPSAQAVTAGTFTVNGATVSVALSDSLEAVLTAISAATAGDVTGSYDAATGKVTLTKTTAGTIELGDVSDTSNFLTAMKLSSGGQTVASSEAVGFAVTATYDHETDKVTLTKVRGALVLGAANDTSNLLAVLKLANNGQGTIASSAALGTVKTSESLADAGLRSAITAVDGDGAGEFTLNGVTFAYNINTTTLTSLLRDINDSDAGVTAAYDPARDRVVLTNKVTGDIGIALSESAGGVLAALGLTAAAGGSLVRGNNAEFTVNGGDPFVSTSNTLDASVHGISGLSVTVNTETEQTLQVESDTLAMQTALESFIEKFNAVQDLIEESTKVTSDGTKVTSAVLAGNREVQSWASRLRALAFDAVSGITGDVDRLDDLGIDFDGTTGHLKIKDSGKLATVLGDTPEEVETLFLTPSTGLVSRLYSYLTSVGTSGRRQASDFAEANTDLDEQIATLQARLEQEREALTKAFIRMLDAQSLAQSQNTYIENTFFRKNNNT
ncbi:MAG: hypothetical protein FJ399_00925 [Verrucomicrobia bacterium]|nr:hypothetical protein [Verrucomicrobiota bacterium]